METIKKAFLNNSSVFIYIILSLLVATLLFPNSFEMKVMPLDISNHLSSSLDISWAVAQNYANFHNLIWGKEFVFTFGPLAPLAIRITWGESKIAFILYDLFYFINIFLITFFSLKAAKNKIFVVLSIISFLILFPPNLGGSYAVVYFFILIFWIFKSIESPSKLSFLMQFIILLILFYTKFNTGLISFVIYYLAIFLMLFDKKINFKKAIVLIIIPIILVVVSSFYLNVELLKYIYYGSEMVSGYNETMYMRAESFSNELEKVLIFVSIIIVYFIWKLFREKNIRINIKNLILMAIFSIAIFVLYKQAFVRADIGHMNGFFMYATFLIFCTGSMFDNKLKEISNILLIPLITLPIFFSSTDVMSNVNSLSLSKKEYFNGLNNSNYDFATTLFPNSNSLPASVLNEIGKQSVDVYPWDIMMLLENDLNYAPRPIIQSYSAYTKELENLNFDFYNSKDAPKYIIYDYETIDNRYPLFDESKVNLAIQLNYHPVEKFKFSNKELILFEQNSNFKPIKLELIDQYAIVINSGIAPKKNVFYEVELYNTLSGKLYSILANAPEVNIKIKTKNNKIIDHKTSNSLLKSGIFSETYFKTTNDIFDSYFDKNIDPDFLIKEYQFVPVSSNYFEDKIKITEYKITQ